MLVVVVLVVVVLVVVVVGRDVVVVGRVVVGVGRVVAVVGPAAIAGVLVVVVGWVRRSGFALAATVTHHTTAGSMVVVVVAALGVVVTGVGSRLGLGRSVWMPLTSVADPVPASRHFETPKAASTTSTATSSPLRTRSSGLWKRNLFRMRLMLLVSFSGRAPKVTVRAGQWPICTEIPG